MTTQPRPPEAVVPGLQRTGLLARVEERLGALLHAEQARCRAVDPRAVPLVDALADLLLPGGERIRPALVTTGYLAAGGEAAGGEAAGDHAADAAVALELLDTGYQIRRDLWQNAPLRRGAPTLHVQHAAEHERNDWGGDARGFGRGVAVLVSDLAAALADRVAGDLPSAARQVWHDLRIGRLGGSYVDSALSCRYLANSWPSGCLGGCTRGCGTGWYAVRHPLLIGAALAGRGDLAVAYQDYARALHAAWRVRGFLTGGWERDWYGELLREVLLDAEERARAEETIGTLLDHAARALAPAPLTPAWRTELTSLAVQLVSP
ncbi:polyprenyl synthetase family protein [Kitasatospora sp. NPDC004799]|uniref:polyprenyl synthetase family protein n=1 Tax=Kitasatospora sp. NPDC004799 TaxID=3154460 RepID=UPI0033B07B15